MNAELQRVEIECSSASDDDFGIEDAARRQLRAERLDQFREIAVQRFLVATLNQDFFAVAKDKRAEAVPLGFEDPVAAGRQITDAFCQHWQDGWVHRKLHNYLRVKTAVRGRPFSKSVSR